ncbi:MAG TPA: hypothetical protein VEF89_06165 [Solirubrobacteraceae bacterium]|nr:hypothetical protein [Solirubrobacteraceae bacterium]
MAPALIVVVPDLQLRVICDLWRVFERLEAILIDLDGMLYVEEEVVDGARGSHRAFL